MASEERGPSARDYWDRVEEVFAAALAAEASARTAVLDARCSTRTGLRAEVEALLAAHARAGDFITPQTVGGSDAAGEDGFTPGTRIGAFRLIERVAHGGMGEVYRAERIEGEFTQQVAIKLIAGRLRGADTIRRFRGERQILASLQHPNIVTLLDGGVTADGQPFIAMEFIDGLPLTEFCRQHAIPLEPRLRLFQQLCAAVGFAHRHLIIHRDLKPGNVFVTTEGVVKVLDFGVAKLVEPNDPTAGATISLLGPMTPNYASPEQVRGQPVTTACDVYGLGVMLYELLAGQRPYETSGKTVEEVVSIVVDREPVRPSAASATGLPYDPRRLRGDLDAVVRKAMAKDPERRYASAEALGDEIGRVLSGQPVVARDPSLLYLTRKAITRYRAAFAVASVALVLLVATLIGAIWQARVAARERQKAEQRFADVRALTNSLVFEVNDAIQSLPGATAARQLIVNRALAYVDGLVADKPRDVALRRELAGAYYRLAEVQGNPLRANLGDIDGALASYRKALNLRQEVAADTRNAPGDVQQIADAEFGIATLLRARGDMTGARTVLNGIVERMEPLVGQPGLPEDPRRRLVATYQRLAEIANSSTDANEAARIVAKAIGYAEALVKQDPADTAARLNLSLIYREEAESFRNRSNYDEALARMRASRAMIQKLVTENPLDTRFTAGLLFALSSEGELLELTGDMRAAAMVYRQQLDVARQRAAGDAQDNTAPIAIAIALRQLGANMTRTGQIDEALTNLQEGRRLMTVIVARDPNNGWAVDSLAALLGAHGDALRLSRAPVDRAQACAAFQEAVRHWDSLKNRNAFPPYSDEAYELTRSHLTDCGTP